MLLIEMNEAYSQSNNCFVLAVLHYHLQNIVFLVSNILRLRRIALFIVPLFFVFLVQRFLFPKFPSFITKEAGMSEILPGFLKLFCTISVCSSKAYSARHDNGHPNNLRSLLAT